jgi:hypothetical protein
MGARAHLQRQNRNYGKIEEGKKKQLKQIKLGKKILNKIKQSSATMPKTCCAKYYLN